MKKGIIIGILALLALSPVTYSVAKTVTKQTTVTKTTTKQTSITKSSKSKEKSGKQSSSSELTITPKETITNIINETPIDVVYKKGKPSIVVTGPQKLLNAIDVDVRNETACFALRSNVRDMKGAKIQVTMPEVSMVILYGSGDFSAQSVNGTSIRFTNNGTGNININKAESTSFVVQLNGSGDCIMNSVNCTSLQLQANGSGDILSQQIKAVSAEVMLNASGDIKIKNYTGTTTRIFNNGSGDMTISGQTTVLNAAGYGSGDINASGLKATRTTKLNRGVGEIYL
jgi:hypothetical protein